MKFEPTNLATGEIASFRTEREAQDFVRSQPNPKLWVIRAVQVPA